VRATTVQDAWYRGLELIYRGGQTLTDERGSSTKELLNLMVVVQDLEHERIPAGFGWSEGRLVEYAEELMDGDPHGFEYTYGQRLRAWGRGIDQIAYVVEKLRASPQTRRACATTWMADVDTQRDEVPCMIVVDFKVRDGSANLTAFFRSHDFAGAYPANLYGLTEVLRYVAGETGVRMGTITTVSASAHIYEHDWERIEKVLSGRYRT